MPTGLPLYRKSTSSSAGSAPSTARSARGTVTPGPARSCFITNAISASTPGFTKRAAGISAGLDSTPLASRNALTGSLTCHASCIALFVKAAFQPATRSPRSSSAARRRSWTPYASVRLSRFASLGARYGRGSSRAAIASLTRSSLMAFSLV